MKGHLVVMVVTTTMLIVFDHHHCPSTNSLGTHRLGYLLVPVLTTVVVVT